MERLSTSPEFAWSFTIRYDPRKGTLMPTTMTQCKVYTLKDLRSIVCMAQGNPREIPPHVLTFIEGSGALAGEVLVKVGEEKTEVVLK